MRGHCFYKKPWLASNSYIWENLIYNLWYTSLLFPAPILVSVGVLQSMLYDGCSAGQYFSTQTHHMCCFLVHSSAMYWQGVPVSAHLSTNVALPPVDMGSNWTWYPLGSFQFKWTHQLIWSSWLLMTFCKLTKSDEWVIIWSSSVPFELTSKFLILKL